jgi:galactitol-specific phosphotransferase system IIC component
MYNKQTNSSDDMMLFAACIFVGFVYGCVIGIIFGYLMFSTITLVKIGATLTLVFFVVPFIGADKLTSNVIWELA